EARHAALISDGQLAAYEGAVDGLKNQIDAKLESLGETDPRGVRRQYGALKDIQRVFNKRALVVGRQAPLTIPQVLGATESIGALLTGHPLTALAGVVPSVLRYLNAPDTLVSRAMKNIAPEPSTPP